MIHLVRNGRVLHDHGTQQRIGELLARHMATANILGRLQVAREVKRRTGRSVELATATRYPHPLASATGAHAHTRHFAEQDPQQLTAGFSVDLPDERATEYIRKLTPVTKEVFDGLTSQYRHEAFTLAGAADQRIIEKVRDALAEVIEKGGTAADFKAAVRHITSEEGVADIAAFSLDTAFNTSVQKAYSLGRYEQMRDEQVMEVLPYWQYWTVGDDRVRPEHRVLHMFTARAEDPVWMKIYPPNGFNCRCSVVPVLADEAPKNADEPGHERLPMLARVLVPQPGFSKVFAVA
jgi:SPP1 gp7 family putative phage head morphogenesis protein